MGLQPHETRPVQPDLSGAWGEEARDQVEDGGLPRAVRADEPEDLAGLHGEREVRDGTEAAEVFAQITNV